MKTELLELLQAEFPDAHIAISGFQHNKRVTHLALYYERGDVAELCKMFFIDGICHEYSGQHGGRIPAVEKALQKILAKTE